MRWDQVCDRTYCTDDPVTYSPLGFEDFLVSSGSKGRWEHTHTHTQCHFCVSIFYRTELLECYGDQDFLAKLHCVRQAFQVSTLSHMTTQTHTRERLVKSALCFCICRCCCWMRDTEYSSWKQGSGWYLDSWPKPTRCQQGPILLLFKWQFWMKLNMQWLKMYSGIYYSWEVWCDIID